MARTKKETQPPQKPKIGRPTSFQPKYIETAEKLCKLGLTDIEIADIFDVALSTFSKWKHDYPAFSEALKSGKSLSDERVERSLYNRAVGYTFDAEEVFQYQGEIMRAKVRKHVPPDTTAAIFWLKNRRRDLWRDVHRHEHGAPGAFDKLSDREMLELLAQEAQTLLLEDQSGGDGNEPETGDDDPV